MTVRATIAFLCAPLLASGLAACGAGSTVSTSSFKGPQEQRVAQTVAHLQSHASALEAEKICHEDLAAALVAQLDKAPGGCKQALESQLKEIDNFDVTIQSIWVEGNLAGAHAKSIELGGKRLFTLTFLREGGKWRISGVS